MIGPIRGLVHAVCRQRWLVAASAVAAFAAGVALSAVSPELYRAEATIALSAADEVSAAERRAGLEAQAALFRRPEIRRPVAAALAGDDPAGLDERLRVRADPGRSLLRVSLEHPDPETAARAVNQLVAAWREQRQDLLENTPRRQLSRRLDDARREQADARDTIAALRQDIRREAVDEQHQLMARQRSRLEMRLRDSELQIAELTRRLESLTAHLESTPRRVALNERGEPPEVLDDARQKLFQLRLQEQELLGRYKESSVLVQRVRDEIAHVQRLLAELERENASRNSGPNPAFAQLQQETGATEAQLRALEGRRDGIAAQITELDAEMDTLAGQQQRLRDAEARAAAAEERIEDLTARLERSRDARAAGAGVVMDIAWVRDATVPPQPAKPRLVADSTAAAGMGLALGVVLALFSERLSPRVSTPRATERRLDLPVLASLADNKG